MTKLSLGEKDEKKDFMKETRRWLILAWIFVLVAQTQIQGDAWIISTLPAMAILAYFIGRFSE